MLPTLQCIVSSGRSRRRRSPLFPAIDAIRSGARYGYRPLHHRLLAGVPELSMAKMGAVIPGSDQSGLGKPLHAYVCHIDDGRFRAEP